MALPQTINPADPLGGASPSQGDNQFRDLKLYIVDVFGAPDNVAVTAAPMSFTAGGLVSIIQSPLDVPTMIRTRQSHMLQINAVYTGVQMLVASNLIGSFTRTGLVMNTQFVEWASGQTGVIGTQGTQPVIIRTNNSLISEHSQTGLLMRTQFVEWASGQTAVLGTVSTQPLLLRSNSLSRWIVDGSGMLLAASDNVVDIGASGANRPRNLFLAGDAVIGDEVEFLDVAADPSADGRFRRSGDELTWRTQDARTATTARNFAIWADTTGVPTVGIGIGQLFQAESADENPSDFGALDFVATDVTAASEDTVVDVLLRVAGAALTAVYRFVATGAFRAIFTHANTADRTYTLPDATDVISLRNQNETLGNKTIATATLTGVTTVAGSGSIVAASVVGSPGQHALYSNNIPKAWGRADTAGVLSESFNVTSITDTAVGRITWTLDRDFGNATYAITPGAISDTSGLGVTVEDASQAAGSFVARTSVAAGLSDPNFHFMICIGNH